MVQALIGFVSVLLGGVLFWAVRKAKDDSFLMRFDDFVVVIMLGLITIGLFMIVTGLTSGSGTAAAAGG